MGVLDSDVFFDSIADLILFKIKDMRRKEMQEYLEVEDDFTLEERTLIAENKLEYLLSIDITSTDAHCQGSLKFPFLHKKFILLKNKFSTPLNVLLARIIERSNGKTAFNLSMLNKRMKNESDRHPIKVSRFVGYDDRWILRFEPGSCLQLKYDKFDESYFTTIKRRKIIAESSVFLQYRDAYLNDNCWKLASFDFVIPQKYALEVCFSGKHGTENNAIFSYFNVQQCPFSSISYRLSNRTFDFDVVYRRLIANDLSKQIELVFIT